MKADMPFLPASGSVIANRTVTLPIRAEEMNCFDPLIRYPVFVFAAFDFRAEASEPACGSVNAKDPMC